jgi:hypothetical protein
MKFQPKTEAQLIEENLSPEGEYDFEVVGAIEKMSKTGNDMIELKLRVYVGDKERIIFDYLLEAMAFKLIHFCEATGLSAVYEAGQLTAEDCIGQSGKLNLVIQEGKGGFASKNSVGDYIVSSEPVQARKSQPATTVSNFDGDEIPF